jgi:pantothenate kinase type III
MKKYLLIDIGNSYIKTAIGLPNALLRNVKSFSYEKEHQHKKLNSIISNFAKQDKSVDEIGSIGVSLLDSKKKPFLKNLLLKYFKLSPLFISKRIILPIKINYSTQLGNDRICSAVAA